MKQLSVFIILLLILHSGFSQSNVRAQLAYFDYPTNGSIDIELSPTIRIISVYKIDSASIPYDWSDTSSPYEDSVQKPLIVIPKFIYDSIPHYYYDSAASSYINLWNKFGLAGYYTNPNDTTLEFEPVELKMGVEYVVIINNVFVLLPNQMLEQVSDTIVSFFKTVLPPHSLVYNSYLHHNGLLSCGDTVKLIFNRKIDSVNTAGGLLVDFYRLTANPADTTYDTVQTIQPYLKDTVSVISWVTGADSNCIYSILGDLDPGEYYEFAINLSRLTGDSTQDERFGFRTKDRFKLIVKAESLDTNDIIPSIPTYLFPTGEYYVHYNDTLSLEPAAKLGEFSFVHWESTTDTLFNNSPTVYAEIIRDKYHLGDFEMTAKYIRTPFDTLTVLADSGGTAIVFDENSTKLTYSLNDTTYRVQRGKIRILKAKPADSGYVFSYWLSSDTTWDGNGSPVIQVPIDNNMTMTPVFTTQGQQNTYRLCADIVYVGGVPEGVDPDAIAVLTAPTGNPPMPYCFTPDLTATSHTVSLLLTDPAHNWGLRRYSVEKPGGSVVFTPDPAPVVENLSPTYAKAVNETSTEPTPTLVTFFVERLEVQLKVEIAYLDGSEPKEDNIFFYPIGVGIPKNSRYPSGKVWIEVYSNALHGILPVSFDGWVETTKPRDQWSMTYKAGELVNLIAKQRVGYEFVGWSTETGYTFAPGNTLELTLNYTTTPVKVKAIYKKKFVLEYVYLKQDKNYSGTFVENRYDPDPIRGNIGYLQKEVEINESIQCPVIKFEFSEPVKRSSIEGNISATEVFEPLPDVNGDVREWRTTYHTRSLFDNAWVNYEFENDDKTVVFYIKRYSYGAGKLMQLFVSITESIESSFDEPLANPTQFDIQTVNPDVEWNIYRAYVNKANDICFLCRSSAELYAKIVKSFPIVKDESEYHESEFTIYDIGYNAPSYPPSTKRFSYHYFNHIVYTKNRINNDQKISVVANVFDSDGDDLNLTIENITLGYLVINGVLSVITNIIGFIGNTAPLFLAMPAAGYIMLAVGVIAGAFLYFAHFQKAFKGKDDFLGSANWLGTRDNLWGYSRSYRKNWRQKCNLSDANVDIEIKVDVR